MHDHVRQLECSNNTILNDIDLLQIRFNSAHNPFTLTKQTSSKLIPKIIYDQVHVGFTIDNIVSMVTYPIRRNKLLKIHDRRSQN